MSRSGRVGKIALGTRFGKRAQEPRPYFIGTGEGACATEGY